MNAVACRVPGSQQTLSWSSGKVSLWTAATGGSILPGSSKSLSADQSYTYYAQGINASGSLRDSEIKAAYTVSGQGTAYDKVKLTVVGATITPFDSILLNATNEVTVTLAPNPPGITSTVQIVCLNGSGSAVFVPSGSTSSNITQSATMKIKGVTASSAVSNMMLKVMLGADVLASNTFTVVGLQEPMKYKIGTNTWADMPDPLYVCEDTTVDFKAIKSPTNAPWPSGKPVWGGVVSGSGMESNSYTFSTISTSAADYKIVSAECGNTVSGKVVVCKVDLVELTYSGTKYHVVKSDDGTTDYTGLHWLDPNHDGNAADGHSYPVCFTRNTKMVVSGKWRVEPAAPGATIMIQGDGPGNLDFTNTILSISGTNGTISNVECMNAFTNEVDFFDPITMVWKCSGDGGLNWINAGTSTNRCYVTLGDPLTTIYHTLAYLGCKNADGQSTSNATADAIYGEFTDRDVRRISDGKQMTYWYNNQMGGRETDEILQRSDANGNCESWSALFRDFLKVQGISADRIMAMPVSSTDGSILVKNWQFNDPPSGTGTYAYVLGTDAIDLDGVPGQGNPNPPGGFNGHWITLFDNQYYDPSYGSTKVTVTDKDKAYEDGALAGYGNLGGTAARKNDTSTNTTSDLNYQVDN